MKTRTLIYGFVALSLAFFSCSSDGGLELSFSTIPGEGPPKSDSGLEIVTTEPVVPAGGVLYVHTGDSVLGPYKVQPRVPLHIKDFPIGSFERLALYYLPEPIDPSRGTTVDLPSPSSSFDELYQAVSSPRVCRDLFADAGAVAQLEGVTVSRGKKAHHSVTLQPLSATVYSADTEVSPPCPDSNGKVVKRFVRLDPRGAESVYVMISSFDGAGIFYAGTFSLYAADGTRLDTATFNREISEDTPMSALFYFPQGETFYLYAEYISRGNRVLPLFYYY